MENSSPDAAQQLPLVLKAIKGGYILARLRSEKDILKEYDAIMRSQNRAGNYGACRAYG